MLMSPRRRIAAACRLLPVRLVIVSRAQDAAAAVEFALVAAPFLALLFAILETALVFFAGQSLEAAVTDAARLIMTGQAQNCRLHANDFKTAVCNRSPACSTAPATLRRRPELLDLRRDQLATPVTNNQFDPTKIGYLPGGPGGIQVVLALLPVADFLSLLSNNLSNLRQLPAAVGHLGFKNEPYSTDGGC